MPYTMQTPQRPLPGAYIQTPAVGNYSSYQSRPSNFRSNSASSQQQHVSQPHMQTLNQQGQAGVPAIPREEVKPIAQAAKAVSEALEQESRYPELDSYIG
ncbi:MAG: hypothetical protein Q9214_003483, partial [Letrouitia sp. 1 TL-2023]